MRATGAGVRARRAIGATAVGAALGLSACGGEQSPDIDEGSGSYPVHVTRASFPLRQHVAATTDFVLAVRNAGDKEIPQLTVTIWTGDGNAAAGKAGGSFSIQTGKPGSTAEHNPVWVPTAGFPKLLTAGMTRRDLDRATSVAGAEAAQTNTYTFGPLAAGASRTVVWRVTPVRPGDFDVHYEVFAGVSGRAKAVLPSGGPAAGSFRVTIDHVPSGGCVVRAAKPPQGTCS